MHKEHCKCCLQQLQVVKLHRCSSCPTPVTACFARCEACLAKRPEKVFIPFQQEVFVETPVDKIVVKLPWNTDKIRCGYDAKLAVVLAVCSQRFASDDDKDTISDMAYELARGEKNCEETLAVLGTEDALSAVRLCKNIAHRSWQSVERFRSHCTQIEDWDTFEKYKDLDGDLEKLGSYLSQLPRCSGKRNHHFFRRFPEED